MAGPLNCIWVSNRTARISDFTQSHASYQPRPLVSGLFGLRFQAQMRPNCAPDQEQCLTLPLGARSLRIPTQIACIGANRVHRSVGSEKP